MLKALEIIFIFERHIIFHAVYLLIELALFLPVVMTIVEHAFLVTKNIKSELRNKTSTMALVEL
jgi:hypothetical protein